MQKHLIGSGFDEFFDSHKNGTKCQLFRFQLTPEELEKGDYWTTDPMPNHRYVLNLVVHDAEALSKDVLVRTLERFNIETCIWSVTVDDSLNGCFRLYVTRVLDDE